MYRMIFGSLFTISLSACAPEVPVDLKSGLYEVKLGYSPAKDICMSNIVPGELKDAVDVFVTKAMGQGDDSATCEFAEFSKDVNRFSGKLVCTGSVVSYQYTTNGSVTESQIKIDGDMYMAAAAEATAGDSAPKQEGTSYSIRATYKGNC
jgi:hypothetical protein